MSQETFAFQTEVGRLLDIVAHSLYSHKEIFLRELISNASDACDRLRYAAIIEPHLTDGDAEFRIRLVVDKEKRTLSIADNGIGMNRQDLIDTLGTIARSGTQAFVSQLTGDAKKDLTLIGQFGVGFYSAFMVADHVEVLTRRAGESEAWRWLSDGKGSFSIESAEREERGTTVILHVNEAGEEFLDGFRLRSVVKTYSDHIGFPIILDEAEKSETLNAASSLWTRPRKDITAEQYKEFYHHVAHAVDEPWLTLHNTVEGVVSYTNLLFIPSSAPFDLFDPERKGRVRLYVNRVFITDDCSGLLPPFLRFVRGVIDTEDLPLNISRESFQHDPRVAKIRSGLVKRILDELTKKAEEASAEFETFWNAFGPVLKEGIYEDFENRDRILTLCRFRSTAGDGLTSLDAYLERMKPGQDAIFTLAGDEAAGLATSPQLEGFRAKGIEVLLLTDPIDEFWVPAVRSFKDKPFKSAAGADVDLSKIAAADGETPPPPPVGEGMERLIVILKDVLKDAVKDVRVSHRLTDSAVCLVAADGDMDMYLERLLRQHRRLDGDAATPRILEINPGHELVRRMASIAAEADAEAKLVDPAHLLLDQARILEGDRLPDPLAFTKRLAALMSQALPADAASAG